MRPFALISNRTPTIEEVLFCASRYRALAFASPELCSFEFAFPLRRSSQRRSGAPGIYREPAALPTRALTSRQVTCTLMLRMRNKLIWFLPLIFLLWCELAEAQQSTRAYRIGFLSSLSPEAVSDRIGAFQQGMHELGYVEGKNFSIEWRYADGDIQRLANLAAELVRLKVDVILTGGPAVNRFAKEATTTIPIILPFDNDPVGNGFAASLARPGGNITGFSTHYPEISGKQLELLNDIVPRLRILAVLGNSSMPGNAQALRETEKAAKGFGVKLKSLDVQNASALEAAFLSAKADRCDAVLVLGSQIVTSHAKQIAAMAANSRLPAIYWSPEFVHAGGLLSYSVSINDLFRRSAVYVDKILKGAKPAELPIEQPSKFELVINLKAAKQIGLTVPPNVLARADRVIR
jgi:putative ABC transport system substrate-binding protein